ncbi:hypothetical protein MS6207_00579 [Escherichia coli]|nr:hypothetical protein [Escherichia coli]
MTSSSGSTNDTMPALRIAMQRRLREFGLTVHPEKTPSDGVQAASLPKTVPIRGKRQTRNVQLPRVHAHQRERSQRQVHADTKDPPGSDDGNSESHQRRSAKALALLNPRTGKMAQESGSGIPELSLGTGQLPHHAEVQDTRNKPLAPGAQAQEPEG